MAGILRKNELAIIIPVLNCLEYTKAMIPTIKTSYPYNLILINNGSTDGTKEYFNQLAADFKITAVHYPANRGVSSAWNAGLRRALLNFGANYFFIPNNDVLLHPDCIDTLVDTFKVPGVVLATATDLAGKVSQPQEVLSYRLPKSANLKEEPDFSCFMLNRKALDLVGYFDVNFFPAYFEDNDYHYRVKLAGLRAVKNSRALYFHYGSRTIKENKEVKEKSNFGYVVNRDYYCRKWGGTPGQERFKKPFNH